MLGWLVRTWRRWSRPSRRNLGVIDPLLFRRLPDEPETYDDSWTPPFPATEVDVHFVGEWDPYEEIADEFNDDIPF